MMEAEPHLTTYVGLDLLAWQEQGVLVLSPKFQRRAVWKPAARSYFIDTLLRGFPVPPLHIRLVREPKRGLIREVVDGQQRLRSLFDFIAGKYRLSRQLDSPWRNKSFDSLEEDERNRLQEYRFQVYQYQNVADATILEIFARINTYSVALSAQELRNGRYFGAFKQTVYSLAIEHLEFWRSARIFTEAAIARMQEAELVSELIILQMDGLQDKKATIDEFYRNLDESWPKQPEPWKSRRGETRPAAWLPQRESRARFQGVVEVVSDQLGDILPESEFRRTPLFYSLYGALYHRIFGLPRYEVKSPQMPLSRGAAMRLREAVEELSDLLSERPRADDLRGWRRDFVIASARQTDNLAPRRDRLRILWEQADLGTR